MIYPPLERRDRALARSNVKFRRPYKLETTLDLGVLVLVARCEASLHTLPQAPYDSTTRGMHVYPSSEHLASLAECFLSSAATATDPAVRPAAERRDGFSGEVTERSKAAGLPQNQFEAKMSAGRVYRSSRPSPLPASDAGTMAGLKHYIPELIATILLKNK